MFECICAHAIYLFLKYFYKKFGSMTPIIWESPKFIIVNKIANHRRESLQHMDQDHNHIHIHLWQEMPQSQEFQGIAVLCHIYQYGSEINI